MAHKSAARPESQPYTGGPLPVRAQLDRLLAHPLFTNSKRYPVFLAYVVEQALLGNAGELKERLIGVEAFGRAADYDVGIDPVVRMSAAEVRKRLIQYYYNPEHGQELIIELPLGSYAPLFSLPQGAQRHDAQPGDKPVPADSKEFTHKEPSRALSLAKVRQALLLALLLVMAAGVGAVADHFKHRQRRSSALEAFWAPITAKGERITYCLGKPGSNQQGSQKAVEKIVPQTGEVNVSDVITLARSIVPTVPHGNRLRVDLATHLDFSQMQEGPLVLIGAFDNAWTMRLTRDLPVTFFYDPQGNATILDRRATPQQGWRVDWKSHNGVPTADYAVIYRMHDSMTGQPAIIVAGITGLGTEAASELLSSPALMDELVKKLPSHWQERNLAIILATQIVDSHAGAPSVQRIESW